MGLEFYLQSKVGFHSSGLILRHAHKRSRVFRTRICQNERRGFLKRAWLVDDEPLKSGID